MRKLIIAILITTITGTMLCACGGSVEKENGAATGTVTNEDQGADAATDAAAEAVTDAAAEAVTDAAADAATDVSDSGRNTLVIKAPGYTGLTNIRKDDNADGTYFYEDMTEDGITIITNMSYPNSQRDGQAMDAYAENIVCAQVDNDAVIKETVEDADLTAKLTYPVYKISWESGSNEDTKQAVGVVVLTDGYTYYFGYKCPIDYFEENADFYNGELQSIDFIEF